MLEGILCIDKPPEHTSFDVVARMRGIAKTRKIGHGGTLDPMATGVLPLFFGRAAKAVDLLPDQDKRYAATFRLGLMTDTQDITGKVLKECPVNVSRSELETMLGQFRGPQEQLPPMYSAVRVGGRRLYDLARNGVEVKRRARAIEIYTLELVGADEEAHSYTVDVHCSKGSYIRTLCHDIGRRLGCGAVLTALRRTKASGFLLEQCITLEQAQQLAGDGVLQERLLPVQQAFAELPRLVLNMLTARHFCNGVALTLNQFESPLEGPVAVFREDETFLGIGAPDAEGCALRSKKLFYLGE